MDNIKDLPILDDSDLVHVAGGSGQVLETEHEDCSDYCDACSGGSKKVSGTDWANRILSCRNCGKIYDKCPVCGTQLNAKGITRGGHQFYCSKYPNYHYFNATVD